jgi:hypothetical protein
MQSTRVLYAATAALVAFMGSAAASSHREAPAITESPKVDGTDFYMFRSYEEGRAGYVTLIANYLPLQDAYGGPNYFSLDPDALYEIHIDNNGNAVEDITFQFRFTNTVNSAAVPVGDKMIPVPLINIGPFGPGVTDGDANKNLIETYSVSVVRGDRRSGTSQPVTNAADGATSFRKPTDNIGNKSIPDYAAYAGNHVYSVDIPGCEAGRMFVGQRKEPFVVNLGEVFDLVNLDPVGAPNARPNTIADKNITSMVMEVPVSCLTAGDDPVIGGWTSASLRQGRVLNPAPKGSVAGADDEQGPTVEGGAFTQVSRLGMPLVNEVVIGLPDKDRFNASEPADDGQFADYVTNPSLPVLLQVLFGVQAPTVSRSDLVAVFLTGVQGLNQPASPTASEMLRLNTSIDPKPAADQSTLGVVGGDTAGFPNGRRPGDDVVDISLRAAMGVLLTADQAPSGQLPYTDGAAVSASDFPGTFPYLLTPLPGSPASASASLAGR